MRTAKPRSRLGTAVLGVVVLLGVAQIAFDVQMVPQWIYQARWSWHYHKERNNPPCQSTDDCLAFATEHCAAPRYMVACYPYHEGVCRCGEDERMIYFDRSVSAPRALEDLEYERQLADAGVEVSP